jgi:hypothetical protein
MNDYHVFEHLFMLRHMRCSCNDLLESVITSPLFFIGVFNKSVFYIKIKILEKSFLLVIQ